MPASSATGRPSARRTAGSGRRGPGASTTTRCATSPWAWPPSASSAATGSRSSATTGRASTAAQVAAQCLGGVSVPVYQDSIAQELAYVWNHAEVSVIVAEDQEQVDKILALRDAAPGPPRRHLRRPARHDRRTGTTGSSPSSDVQEAGRSASAPSTPATSRPRSTRASRDDVAIVCYTSGTTGNPKGAMITHANAIGVAEIFCAGGRVARPRTPRSPTCRWPGRATRSTRSSRASSVGFCANCPESPETVQRDLRELGPTTVLAPPRIWENMLTAVQVRAADATPLKRRIFEYFRSRRGARRDPARGRQARPRGAAPGHARSASSSSTVPCAISSASDRRSGRSPAARRSAPTRSGSSGPSASTSSRSTGPRRRPGSCRSSRTPRPIPPRAGRPVPGRRGEDRRPRRGPRARLRRLQGLSQERRGHARGHRPRGVVPHRRRRLHRSARPPRHHRPRQGRGRPRRRHAVRARSSSRTSSSSARTSARRWPSATSGPFVAAMIAIDLGTVGNWAERRGLAYTTYMDLSQKAGGARPRSREEIAKAQRRRCRRRRRSAASCCSPRTSRPTTPR